MVSVYDLWGRKCFQSDMSGETVTVTNLNRGVYIVRWGLDKARKVAVF
jgi:hypothetical protein